MTGAHLHTGGVKHYVDTGGCRVRRLDSRCMADNNKKPLELPVFHYLGGAKRRTFLQVKAVRGHGASRESLRAPCSMDSGNGSVAVAQPAKSCLHAFELRGVNQPCGRSCRDWPPRISTACPYGRIIAMDRFLVVFRKSHRHRVVGATKYRELVDVLRGHVCLQTSVSGGRTVCLLCGARRAWYATLAGDLCTSRCQRRRGSSCLLRRPALK
jgi:hypothetical protein